MAPFKLWKSGWKQKNVLVYAFEISWPAAQTESECSTLTLPLIWWAVRWQMLFMFIQLKIAVNIPWAAANDLTVITWQSGASAEETSGCMCFPFNVGAKTICGKKNVVRIICTMEMWGKVFPLHVCSKQKYNIYNLSWWKPQRAQRQACRGQKRYQGFHRRMCSAVTADALLERRANPWKCDAE